MTEYSPFVEAALALVKPPEPFQMRQVTIEIEPGGEEYAVLLVDCGIKGIKKYRIPIENVGRLTLNVQPEPEAEPVLKVEGETVETEPEAGTELEAQPEAEPVLKVEGETVETEPEAEPEKTVVNKRSRKKTQPEAAQKAAPEQAQEASDG